MKVQAGMLTGIVKHISTKPTQNGYYLDIQLVEPIDRLKQISENPELPIEQKVTIFHSNKTIGQILFEKLLPY